MKKIFAFVLLVGSAMGVSSAYAKLDNTAWCQVLTKELFIASKQKNSACQHTEAFVQAECDEAVERYNNILAAFRRDCGEIPKDWRLPDRNDPLKIPRYIPLS